MIAGPQDECIECPEDTKLWIDEANHAHACGSSFYTALGHGPEPLFDIMKDNWMRMKASDDSINQLSAEPSNVDFALKTEYSGACKAPLVTDVKFTCGGKEHCSTAIDDSVHFVEKSNGDKLYLSKETVWSSIVMGVNDKNPCKRSY